MTDSKTNDPLSNLMAEAEQLMEEMDFDVGDADAATDVDLSVNEDAARELMDSIVIDGFAIDSDEEEQEESGVVEAANKSESNETKVPAAQAEEPVPKHSPTQEAAPTENGTSIPHPLQEGLLIPPPSVSTTTPPSSQTTLPSPAAAGNHSNSIPTSNLSDVVRSNTRLFASNLASLAQKAASQVAAATAVPEVVVPPPSQTTTAASQATPELGNDQKKELIETHIGDLLPGERVIMFLSHLMYVKDSCSFQEYSASEEGMWCCCMTYYRVLLFCTATNSSFNNNMPASWNPSAWISEKENHKILQMPLASMDRVERTSATPSLVGLVIYGKDNGRMLSFATPSYPDTVKAHEALQTYAFPGRRNLGYLFAFESKRQHVMASLKDKSIMLEPTRKHFDALVEYPRQLRNLQIWTSYTQLNAQYQLCLSYPNIVVGPASLQETSSEAQRILRGSASFRSEHRLPALTWSSGIDGASLWRSSQPKVGLQGNRNAADELLLKHVAESARSANAMRVEPLETLSNEVLQQLTGASDLKEWTVEPHCHLKILDLRPRSSAMANRTGGYGYENTSYYTGTTLQFCNIGNIHAVRDSYQRLSALCLSTSVADVQWSQLVEDTKWLSHVRLILAASWEAAFWVHVKRLPVLLHCSHGWDRTSQVAVLAQLFLDPFYRTREGFATLVEKDFMSFGHPFHTRCAHGEGRGDRADSSGAGGDEGQISPIFLQFLDCVYQVVHQYPECFEFNTKYLLMLSEHVYSCRFGTMLCDTEREREVIAGIRQRTHCLWEYLNARDDLVNKRFTASGGVLLMPLPSLLRNVTLWADRHCMYGPKRTLRTLPSYLERPKELNPHDQQAPLYTSEDYHDLSLEYHNT